ncbi:type II secretion system F family protein [Bacillus mangrovi]|uniref:Type II secretion system F family protein n=1 Tax=Metabacillus mangrovi TaxID=1491830 RepID=A0A7X2S2X8_9BACI|nr:competence type IV pilus assembly protein ComGB [Metabacillus mangrovi]MTH52402.1 type II secretion system F family protein [Metabacillus mangrovi]
MKNKWGGKQQFQFISRLNGLIEKGYSLDEAIRFLSFQESRSRQNDLRFCLEELKNGKPLFQVLHHLGFHKDAVSYLFFAERHGDLAFSLKESSELLQRKQEQFRKISSMLRYPAILILIMIGVLYIVQVVIAPQFLSVYESMNMEPSLFNIILLQCFRVLSFCAAAVPCAAALLFLYYYFRFRKKNPSTQMAVLVKIPLLKETCTLFNSYYISLQLSNLLKAGLSYYETLLIFKEQSLHPFFSEEADRMIGRLKNGERFDQLFRQPHYDGQLSEIVSYGQKNGMLYRELYTYSQFTLTRMEAKLSAAAAVLQPAVFSAVGLIVLLVYLSMILPMYQMINQI